MEPGIVTNTFNPSTVQRQVDLRPAVPSETLSPKKKRECDAFVVKSTDCSYREGAQA